MKNSLRIYSIAAFALAIPALIITDWYFKDYGIFMMFLFVSIGLILDQIIRKTQLLNIFALVLFVESPVALIYGNRFKNNIGLFLMLGMICLGIVLNQISKYKFKEGEL